MTNRIKDVIKEKGYTITSLAEKMGMTRESLSRIIVSPSSPTLEKLSNALDVPVWQFFASLEDIVPPSSHPSGISVTCPKCGTEIPLEVGVKEK